MRVNDDVVILSDWTQALSVYESLNLDDIVNIYLRFGKKGRLNGFPIINIWQGGFCEKQVYYAMMYLLERALNELTLTKMHEGKSIVYHVDLKLPDVNEDGFIKGSKLYSAAIHLIRLTQNSREYQKDEKSTVSLSGENLAENDAVRRIKVISEFYRVPEKYPLMFYIESFIFFSICAWLFFPAHYQNFETYFTIFLLVTGMWVLARSSKKPESEITISKAHVMYLNNNVILQTHLSRIYDLHEDVSLEDLDLALKLLEKERRVNRGRES